MCQAYAGVLVLSIEDVRAAHHLADALRNRHDESNARLVERLLGEALRREQAAGPSRRDFMTTGEAARLVGVSLQTIKNWVAAGELEGARLGGRTLVRRRSVASYLERLSPSTAPLRPLGTEQAATAQREERLVRQSLPASLVARVEQLSERESRGEQLTRAEQTELRRLVRQATRTATAELAQRVASSHRD